MEKQEIFLFNDSFPPLIDGVANTVVNYAENMKQSAFSPVVLTPDYPGADDSGFDFPVIRYPSIDLEKLLGYRAGFPFEIQTLLSLKEHNVALLHSHCPMASNFMARMLREQLDVPMITTYHTKFDVDIANALRGKLLQQGAIKAVVESVSAADELWVVSRGAGENIRSLGYEGDYVVMENGVDIPRGRASEEEIARAVKGCDLPQNVPVFLFVGRLMWYKGIRIILEALAALKSQALDFRMVFIGSGGDEAEIKDTTERLKLGDKVFFTGPIRDRSTLVAWYSRADLFLFPSTFDTNGLVVREAAACSLGTVMIADSCAAEGVTNGLNGLMIEENAASLAVCLARIMDKPQAMKEVGSNASRDLYISWEASVQKALHRYEIVIDNYKCGKYTKKKNMTDMMLTLGSDFLDGIEKLNQHMSRVEDFFDRY